MEKDKIIHMIYELNNISAELDRNEQYKRNVENGITVLVTLFSSYITTLFLTKLYSFLKAPRFLSKETQILYEEDSDSSSSSCSSENRRDSILQDLENLAKEEKFYNVDISS